MIGGVSKVDQLGHTCFSVLTVGVTTSVLPERRSFELDSRELSIAASRSQRSYISFLFTARNPSPNVGRAGRVFFIHVDACLLLL